MTIIEKLWNNAISSNEVKKPSHPRYDELLNTAHETEQQLLTLLTDDGKELYGKLSEVRTELYCMDEYEIFKNGFQTGAKIMLEITNTDE